jgi:hypothetical protein
MCASMEMNGRPTAVSCTLDVWRCSMLSSGLPLYSRSGRLSNDGNDCTSMECTRWQSIVTNNPQLDEGQTLRQAQGSD